MDIFGHLNLKIWAIFSTGLMIVNYFMEEYKSMCLPGPWPGLGDVFLQQDVADIIDDNSNTKCQRVEISPAI